MVRCQVLMLRIARLALAGLLLFMVWSHGASAEVTHEYSGVSFGPDGPASASNFARVQSITVDPANGDVLVYDGGDGRIYRFDSQGYPVEFPATGTNFIEGVGGSSGASAENEVAVAPPGSAGGTEGDIYVANASSSLAIYSPEGTPLEPLEVKAGGEVCGVAVNSVGHLLAAFYPGPGEASENIVEYVPSTNPPSTSDRSGQGGAGPNICNVASDSLGHIYAANYLGEGLYRLESLAGLGRAIDPHAATMAIDPADNDLYAYRGSGVFQYSPNGSLLGHFSLGMESEGNGVAVQANGATVYVGAVSRVRMYGPMISPPPEAGGLIPGSCPNEAYRTGAGATLPDCRSYEQVSPEDKGGAQVEGSTNTSAASLNGESVSFLGNLSGSYGAAGSQETPIYRAVDRGAVWATQAINPPPRLGLKASVLGFSRDQQYALATAGYYGSGFGLYLEDLETGLIETIVPPREDFVSAGANSVTAYAVDGVSENDQMVFFETTAQLTSQATAEKNNIYVWDRRSQALSLVGVLPNGESSPGGTFGGPYRWTPIGEQTAPDPSQGGASAEMYVQEANAFSSDGEQIYFTTAESGGDPPQIFLRQHLGDSIPRTLLVSGSQKTNGTGPGGSDPNGPQPAAFIGATPDGSSAIFLSSAELTNDATTGPGDEGADLYRFDALTGGLTDLVPDNADLRGAEVHGVLGMSSDGRTVYFVASAALAPGASPAECRSESGGCNLYRYQDAGLGRSTVTFIARLRGGETYIPLGRNDNLDWVPGTEKMKFERTSRVSPDGRVLLFASYNALTGYDNRSAGCQPGGRCSELFRYSADTNELTCISCNPSGAPPNPYASGTGPVLASMNMNVQVPPEARRPALLTRNLTDEGKRIFFQSPDSLVQADSNGLAGCRETLQEGPSSGTCQDVYEWEEAGAGSCAATAPQGHCLYLISTGQGNQPSYFVDADPEGRNVFFITASQLVPADEDNLADMYDARVEGGIPAQFLWKPNPCNGEECQGPSASAPNPTEVGSSALRGPGNAKPPKAKKKKSCKRGKGIGHGRKGRKCTAHRKKSRNGRSARKHHLSGGSK